MFILTQTNFTLPITTQDIYNILGIIGFILSAILSVRAFIKSRESYTIFVIDYEKRAGVLQLLIAISNNSSSPLIIRSISCGGIDCEIEPKPIRGKADSFDFVATSQFPLCLSAYGCQYSYLEFLDYQHTSPTPGTNLILEIHSTRKLERKTLSLGEKSHYLHTREQLRSFQDSRQKT